MRFVAYPSKLWNLTLLVIVLSLLGLFAKFTFPRLSLSWEGVAIMVFTLLWSAGVVALACGLVSGKAAIEIDENGIMCCRAYYSRIAWDDVISAARAPRREVVNGPDGEGVRICFSEAWRPVDIQIRDLEKYATGRVAGFHRAFIGAFPMAPRPPVSWLRLEMCGLAASSEDAIRVIEYYLALKRETRGEQA